MPSKELIDAIRTGRDYDALLDAITAWCGGMDGPATCRTLAEAIAAARAKPEDMAVAWILWDDGPRLGSIGWTAKAAVDRCVQSLGVPPDHICQVTITRKPINAP